MPRSRSRRSVLSVVAILLASLVAGCTTGSDGPPPEQSLAQQFLDAVGRADAATASGLTTSPQDASAALAASLAGLGAKGTLTVTHVETKGDSATAAFSADWTVPGVATHWTYTGSLPLQRTDKTWQVLWRDSDLHPALAAGTHLTVVRTQADRGTLLDSDGKPLFSPTPVVEVGIEPKLVTDLPKLAKAIAAVPQLQTTAAELTAAVKAAASPTDFVPVITLRKPVYDSVRSRIHDLDGTVFHDGTQELTQSSGFGAPLLGAVGPATADIVKASNGRIDAGDQTGLGGLQQALDTTLAGTAGVTVATADADGQTVRTIGTLVASKKGTDVRLTLDRALQSSAEKAVDSLGKQAAIVAVDRSTGAILADANSPQATYDLGLAGAFPAGSTFKIATWVAAFTADKSLTPSSKVDCPATVTVDGRQFENENKFSHPPIPVAGAFGYSCNTSAINVAMKLPAAAVGTAAKSLGLGADWSLPVDSFAGSVPAPATATERAADAIGQGRVQVSPLLMALMAATASSGKAVRPSVLAGKPAAPGAALPQALVTQMNTLMKATVDLPGGTGHALSDLPGVEGKTGTAEYGNDTPPRSHAWFAGVQGNVAFAVFVYDGASAKIDPVSVTHAFIDAST